MTAFLEILAFYYLCDSVAQLRPLEHTEILRCSAAYEQVKAHFLPLDGAEADGAERHANTAAYLGFKAWETDNADLVGDLRRAAEGAARTYPGL